MEEDLQRCWRRFRDSFTAHARRRADRFIEARTIFGDGFKVHPSDTEIIDGLLGSGNGRR